MNEIKLNMEKLSDAEREQLMTLIKKANKPKKVWKPKYGETYYWVDIDGYCLCATWVDESLDNMKYNIGSVFSTISEAREDVKRREILTKWKRLSIESGENKNEWNGNNCHWYCYYDDANNRIKTSYGCTCHTEGIHFSTGKSLLDAISEIGEENVKKYILGIKE